LPYEYAERKSSAIIAREDIYIEHNYIEHIYIEHNAAMVVAVSPLPEIPCSLEKIPCSDKKIPCSVEQGIHS
jgi:hypothetical protein